MKKGANVNLKQSLNYLCNIVDESIWGSGKQILMFAHPQSVLIDLGPKIPLLPLNIVPCFVVSCLDCRLWEHLDTSCDAIA